ncbi:hypothetical protein BSKO_11370 [Bryopsis sp. KO-2023]|nr:hypothetical protein BSKO_11370 [Bryopsis sp. KO-2023]
MYLKEKVEQEKQAAEKVSEELKTARADMDEERRAWNVEREEMAEERKAWMEERAAFERQRVRFSEEKEKLIKRAMFYLERYEEMDRAFIREKKESKKHARALQLAVDTMSDELDKMERERIKARVSEARLTHERRRWRDTERAREENISRKNKKIRELTSEVDRLTTKTFTCSTGGQLPTARHL